MIHIKETEIIPLLKEAQTEYSQKITEGDPKDVEMAERIEEALTQAMDIVYDYQSMADEHKRMVEKYETEPNQGGGVSKETAHRDGRIHGEHRYAHQKHRVEDPWNRKPNPAVLGEKRSEKLSEATIRDVPTGRYHQIHERAPRGLERSQGNRRHNVHALRLVQEKKKK